MPLSKILESIAWHIATSESNTDKCNSVAFGASPTERPSVMRTIACSGAELSSSLSSDWLVRFSAFAPLHEIGEPLSLRSSVGGQVN